MAISDNLNNGDCCVYPDLKICDAIDQLPNQYQQSENIHKLMEVFLNQLNCIYSSLSAMCGVSDCSELTGDALSDFGASVGFPRCHCNVKCFEEGEYCIEDDELYCRLIKTHLISRQGNTVENLCCALENLFGESAFIISSTGGLTQVSSGRPLTSDELCIIELLRRVLPHTCGTSVEIYDIPDMSQIVGINCGDCNQFAGACEGLGGICNPINCSSLELMPLLECPSNQTINIGDTL